MALIKCAECGHDVSTQAKACPSCGAKVVVPKKTSVFTWLVGAIMAAAIIGGLSQGEKERAKERAAVASETPEQKAKREHDAAMSVSRLSIAMALKETLTKAARDPDSLVIESMHVSENGDVACAEYRARNGFGGMNRSYVAVVKGKVSQGNSAVWNANCTKPMYDLTSQI